MRERRRRASAGRRITGVVLACVAPLALAAADPADAKTLRVSLQYELDANSCVAKIDVVPEKVHDPSLPHDVIINSLKQKLDPRKVVWTLEPKDGSGDATGVVWKMVELGAANAGCESPPELKNGKFECKTWLKLASLKGRWDYTVKAVKGGCGEAEVDPAIIFRGGSGGFLPLILLLVAAGAITAVYLRRRSGR